ncbi:MAG: VCBS repeat-containing protein [Bryobacterales bacterium]|nr:VCBS repeat-containing protein [Bryobacterales bacterium]
MRPGVLTDNSELPGYLPFLILLWQTPFERGQAAFQVKDWPAAERWFAEALRALPSDAAVHKWLGMTYAAQEKFVLAEAPFRRACELKPTDPDACYYHGRTLYVLGRLEPALGAFEKARKTGAKPGRVLLGLALAHEKLNHFAEADKLFRDAIAAGDKQALEDYARFRRQPRTPAPGAAPTIRFEQQELPFTVRNGAAGKRHLPETMIAGVAILDYDNDGRLDLFFANGASMPGLDKRPHRFWNGLLRNKGNGEFEDATQAAGLQGAHFAMGVAAADYDNDGDADLFVTGVNGAVLYNNRGDGTFAPVAIPAIDGWSVAAAWFDYDRDGRLDLFVVRYVDWNAQNEPVCGALGVTQYCHPKMYAPLANVLLHNRGDGTFEEVSERSGIGRLKGKGMGVAIGDLEGDNWPDVFVGNDTTPNFLFRNNRDGTFSEVALEANAALSENGTPVSSMGVEWKDWNNDGRDDLFITALSNEMFPLFKNLGARFGDVTLASGVGKASLAWSGWSSAVADFDNDGWKDLATANGHVMDNAEVTSGRQSRQPCQVYRNRGDGTFDASAITGTAFHRGLAWADLDNDGRLDLVATRLNEPAVVLWNRTPAAGNWTAFRLHGRTSNRDGIGARIKLLSSAGGAQWSRVTTAGGYGASVPAVAHFGLAQEDATQAVVEVEWPSGRRQTIRPFKANTVNEVVEPE